MNYATKQLTRELRELTKTDNSQFQNHAGIRLPPRIQEDSNLFSEEVESFLRNKREYARKTRSVSEGRY